MLEIILDRISQGGAFSTQSLAQELGVSKELVEAMLANLARAGYL
jgi:Mn-dependent DtxR family transcriptional regulator